MRQTTLIFSRVPGSSICFAGYYVVLTDWMQLIKTDLYKRNYLDAAVETAALATYTDLAIHFIRSRITRF